jgi:transcriptional regulator with XRE-family HTH domain
MPSRVKVALPGLRRSRELRGLSQKELEKLAGVSFITISRVENGHLDTTMGTAEKLAKALRTKVRTLTLDDATFTAELERKIEGLDLADEDALADAYADLALLRGGTKKAIKDVLLEAIKQEERRE